MQIVHVIPPAGVEGDRHEEHFPDDATAEQIIDSLTKPRVVAGRIEQPIQLGYGLLKDGELYLDHPGTVVAVGENRGGKFHETKRLHGPAAGGGQ